MLIAPQRLARQGQPLELSKEEQHYLRRVLRLRPGDGFAISDGQGQLWQGQLGAEGQALQGPLLEQQPPPQPRLVLLAGLMRRELEPMLRMGTELGLDRFVPLRAERSLPDPGDQRQDRWQTLVKEACEQCERLWQPQLEAVVSAAEALARPRGRGERRWIAVTREAGVPSLLEQLQGLQHSSPGETGDWQLACGPEGGWSPMEREIAAGAGWQPVSLGPTILRAATAALVGVTLMQQQRSAAAEALGDRLEISEGRPGPAAAAG